MLKLNNILGVFCALGDRVELIFVWGGQASWDTSLDTQQRGNRSNMKIHFIRGWPPLRDPLNMSNFCEKNVPEFLVLYLPYKTLAEQLWTTFFCYTITRGTKTQINVSSYSPLCKLKSFRTPFITDTSPADPVIIIRNKHNRFKEQHQHTTPCIEASYALWSWFIIYIIFPK